MSLSLKGTGAVFCHAQYNRPPGNFELLWNETWKLSKKVKNFSFKQSCPRELSFSDVNVLYSVPFDAVATSHMYPLGIWNVASATEELNFNFS